MPGSVRRKLAIDESLRISKLFFELLLINDNHLEWQFHTVPIEDLRTKIQARSIDIMKKFLKRSKLISSVPIFKHHWMPGSMMSPQREETRFLMSQINN